MIASTYLAVLGDINAPLSEVFVIAEKPFTSLFGQPFVLSKVMTSKIIDHDAATPFVVFLLSDWQRQIEMCTSRRPFFAIVGAIFNEFKTAKPPTQY